ncbi:hypothetical protein SKAU_G00111150 [Synaphobranchus kaupii]|uniref:Uncharacterized protein n=1 Tax=Synaphobranchus kaupii TaxID=118154 RepID=A0A9Q1J7C2_SYNKA|nr:hypothetical protein SKAU_G00111150 [Synaphobranchus kaupii]
MTKCFMTLQCSRGRRRKQSALLTLAPPFVHFHCKMGDAAFSCSLQRCTQGGAGGLGVETPPITPLSGRTVCGRTERTLPGRNGITDLALIHEGRRGRGSAP